MKAQWKSKSKRKKQLKVSNTDPRKAINTHLILWKPNGKANQNLESNLKFQAVTSEKQHASNWKSNEKANQNEESNLKFQTLTSEKQ